MKKTFLTLGLMALSAMPLMAGTSTTVTTIDDDNDNSYRSAITRYEGHTAVAYVEDGDLKLWLDDGAGEEGIANDGIANGDEIVVIDNQEGSIGGDSIDMIVYDDKLTIAYFDNDTSALKVWHDDGHIDGDVADEDVAGNALADEDEIRTLVAGPFYIKAIKMAAYNGTLAISYVQSGEGLNVNLWIDDGEEGDAGNFEIDDDEVRFIDNASGISSKISLIENNDQLTIAYFDYNTDQLRYWSDDGKNNVTTDATNSEVDDLEIRTFDGHNKAGANLSAVSYEDNTALFFTDDHGRLSLWIDNGRGEGTAGDNDIHQDEIRVITYVRSAWADPSATIVDGKLACVYYDRSDAAAYGASADNLAIWIDGNSNGEYDAGEITTIDAGVISEDDPATEEVDEESDGDVGNNPDVVVEGSSIYISYDDRDAENIKLARITQDSDGAQIPGRKSDGTCVVASQGGLMSALAALALLVLSFGFMKNKTVVSKQ